MDREILFRGKRKDNGEYVYGNLFIPDKPDTPTQICIGTNVIRIAYDVVPETVGQYTGLTDKNGKRIFEGDIVKGVAFSTDFIGVITWIDEIAGFGVRYFNERRTPTAWENSSILKMIQKGHKDQFAAEIIGNIHSNPDLLEVSE